MAKTHTLHVSGMHCASCVVLTEEALSGAPGVDKVSVSLKKRTVTVTGDLPESATDTATLLTVRMPAGYALTAEPAHTPARWHEFIYAIPAAILFIFGFIALQRTGIVNIGTSGNTGLGAAFFIGLIASVSTCLAVVGGLVLSVSANYAHRTSSVRPQLLFHAGRVAGFFVLGGLLGVLGNALQLGPTGLLWLSLIVAVIMLILGFNLLDITHHASKLQLRLPRGLLRFIRALEQSNHALIPCALGAATFFLPCGFTQSMQAYALTTGSFMSGGLTMLFFALGTLPMLALISFGATGIAEKPWRGIFFKAAGLVVIALALMNGLSALAVAGIIDPLF